MQKLALLLIAVTQLLPAQGRKIVVTGMGPDTIAEFQSAAPGARIVAAETDKRKLLEQVADADAILGTINPALLQAATKLKWVHIFSAGVERYCFPEMVNSAVVLTNSKDTMGSNIADHSFSMLLALTRDLHQIIPARTREQWNRSAYHPIELRGKTAVIVGVGDIGSQIAQRAHGFGMDVIGVDPKPMPPNPHVGKMVHPDQLDSVLPQADVLFIAAPLTPQTEGMIGPKQFESMKKGSYFIAVSRGKLYNTAALVKALDEQRLAGAGLDVTNPEPLPKGHPLWKFENVIITPHMAGQSDSVQSRRMDLVKANIARFVKGEPLLNIVDKSKGY